MKKITKYLVFILIIMVVIAALVSTLFITEDPTQSKYVKRDADELRAYYTTLYFSNTGNGSVIALENGKGYVTFNVMNYVDANVSQRDIIYDVVTLDEFYTQNGVLIPDVVDYLEADDDNQLYALDVWGVPQRIQRDTYKYNYNITLNSGNFYGTPGDPNSGYIFPASEGANHHTVTVEITQTTASDIDTVENISVIIKLVKPYKQIFIINAVVSSRLIVFSSSMQNVFNVDLMTVSTQSADIFGYRKDLNNKYVPRVINDHNFTSYAFKVTYEWNHLIVNENDIDLLHNNQETLLTGAATYKDISKPYVVSMTQDTDTGQLVMYVPQKSDYSFECFITDYDNYYITATVEIYDQATSAFTEYDSSWGGYSDESTDGLCEIILVE